MLGNVQVSEFILLTVGVTGTLCQCGDGFQEVGSSSQCS